MKKSDYNYTKNFDRFKKGIFDLLFKDLDELQLKYSEIKSITLLGDMNDFDCNFWNIKINDRFQSDDLSKSDDLIHNRMYIFSSIILQKYSSNLFYIFSDQFKKDIFNKTLKINIDTKKMTYK